MEAMDERDRFAALFAEHWKPILGFAARRCRTIADAGDVAAEVFLVAWRRMVELPPGDGARLWLYAVARNAVANHRRGEIRRERLGRALLDACVEEWSVDPADLIAIREDAAMVRAALGTLRAIDADLLTLTAWEGLTSAQAARVVGISAEAARTRIFRARRKLRQHLGQLSGQDTFPNSLTMEARP